MFIYLFVCFFMNLFVFFILMILGHPQKVTLKILWRSNLILLRYLGSKNVYMLVCLFVCLLIFFYFNNLGTPTWSYPPENFVNIQLDLAEILRILNILFVYFLLVCLLIYLFFILIIVEYPQEVSLKISWRSDLIWLTYIGF